MAKELNEDTTFKLSIKTMGGMAILIFTLVSMWFVLQADIAEAKELPKPEVSKMEFQMKDANIRLSIENTEKTVDDIKQRMIRLEEKIDDLR
jgi:hypothetical protein|tara:strand:+ start:179 stop:454 length:276 start_codon:yes stop_codon:yes gene_type:complete